MSHGDYADADAKCPFYMEQGSLYVKCEGMTPRGNLTLRFMRKKEKARWITLYCNTIKGCQKCTLWRVSWMEWEKTHPEERTIDDDEIQPMPGGGGNDDSI